MAVRDIVLVLGFTTYLITIEDTSPQRVNIMIPRINQTEIPEGIRQKHSENNLDAPHLKEKEFEKLKQKWAALRLKTMANYAVEDIPTEWLLPTTTKNVTFKATKTEGIVAKKLATLIKKHQVSGKTIELNQIFAKNVTNKSIKHQALISVKDKLENMAKKVSSSFSNHTNESNSQNMGEYPGKNETMRQHISKQWDKYYTCLRKSNFKPRAHYVFPGETIV